MVQMIRRGIRRRLADDFVPEKYTVLCGRGKEYTTSTGNRHLKSLVHKYLKVYSEAKTKGDKSAIITEIMEEIKGVCQEAAFVKLENDAWWEVDYVFAREKIGCMFRHPLLTQYRSSTTAKFARKKAKSSAGRRNSSPSLAESVQSIMSTQSTSSTGLTDSNQSYSSTLAEKVFGSQTMRVHQAEPTVGANPLHDYYSLLSSYLTQGQAQLKHSPVPINHCVMPMKSQPSAVPTGNHLLDDDFPDDLSGIFDDI